MYEIIRLWGRHQKKTNFVSIVLFRTAKRVFCTFAHVEGVDVGRIFRNFALVEKKLLYLKSGSDYQK